ncbi:MAG: hypothetical protein JXR77_09480, partial [Lentisphaeria bacterium]|nr:hypothetical protein [Lentisphaeria bacterium]
SPTVPRGVLTSSSAPRTPVHAVLKRADSAHWVFAVAMYREPAQATFRVAGLPPRAKAVVLGEEREIPVADGSFTDAFEGYGVHLYRIQTP